MKKILVLLMAAGFIGTAAAQPAPLPEGPLPASGSHAVNQAPAEKAPRVPRKKLHGEKSKQAHKSLKPQKKHSKKHKKGFHLPKDCCD